MSILGFIGFLMAAVAHYRIGNLEKKLKQFDVIPHDFDSGEEEPEAG